MSNYQINVFESFVSAVMNPACPNTTRRFSRPDMAARRDRGIRTVDVKCLGLRARVLALRVTAAAHRCTFRKKKHLRDNAFLPERQTQSPERMNPGGVAYLFLCSIFADQKQTVTVDGSTIHTTTYIHIADRLQTKIKHDLWHYFPDL